MAHPVGPQGGWPYYSYERPRYSDEIPIEFDVEHLEILERQKAWEMEKARVFEQSQREVRARNEHIYKLQEDFENEFISKVLCFFSSQKEAIIQRTIENVFKKLEFYSANNFIPEQATVKYDEYNDDYSLEKSIPFTLLKSNEDVDLEIISYASSNDGYDEYDNDYALEKSTHFMLPESNEDVNLETISCMSSENDYYSVVNDFDDEYTDGSVVNFDGKSINFEVNNFDGEKIGYNITNVDEENVGFKIENFDRDVDYNVINYDGKIPNFYVDNFDIENFGKTKENIYANYGVKNDREKTYVNYFDKSGTDIGITKFHRNNYYVNEWIPQTYNYREIGDNRNQNLIYDRRI